MTLEEERQKVKTVSSKLEQAKEASRCWNCHEECDFLFKAFMNTVNKRVGAFCSFTCAAAYAKPQDVMYLNFESLKRLQTFTGNLPPYKLKKEYGGTYTKQQFSESCRHRFDGSPEFYINKKRKLFNKVLTS